jgi:hypothetical protein
MNFNSGFPIAATGGLGIEEFENKLGNYCKA